MNKKYTVNYFIKKFSAIPAKFWTTGTFYEAASGSCCALGHCGVRSGGGHTPEGEALRSLIRPTSLGVTEINDYASDTFPQATPRDRILAALRFIQKKA